METPQSTRRVTRSQTRESLNTVPTAKKNDEMNHVLSKQRNENPNRSVLFDITNDSPVIGLAMEGLEAKRKDWKMQTVESGEALLRGQVRTLLQKVEEEAEISKLCSENRPFLNLEGFVNSPTMLLNPTPANTPNLWKLSYSEDTNINFNGVASAIRSEAEEEESKIDQVVTEAIDELKQETPDSPKSLNIKISDANINFNGFASVIRSEAEEESKIDQVVIAAIDELIQESLDSQKGLNTKISDSPVITKEEHSDSQQKLMEEDDASVWSIQVNVSTQGEDEDFEDEEEEDFEDEQEEEGNFDEKKDQRGLVDELCEGLRNISVQDKRMKEFTGKHIRFVYNSDDEIEGEEEVKEKSAVSPSILRLNGMPIPEGKHLRFPEEEEED